jgi:transcriptional regulator with XRE-family HTH domain
MDDPVTRIPSLLRAQGRSVQWFCRNVGIHRSYYWMMETGHRPLSASYLSRAADVLGVPVEMLVSTSRNVTEPSSNIADQVSA